MSPSDTPPDLRLGPFTLGTELGRGGMGVVYGGVHVVTGFPVDPRRVAPRVAGRRSAETDLLDLLGEAARQLESEGRAPLAERVRRLQSALDARGQGRLARVT